MPWYGAIPKHWNICRCKYLFTERIERSEHGNETNLVMSQKHGLIPASKFSEHRLRSESYAGGKLCDEGDLVLNRLKAHLGVFSVSPQHGVISPDYTVLIPNIERINPAYAQYALKSDICRRELRIRVRGVVEGFWRLYTDDFNTIILPLPPLTEQDQIVRYLDWKLSQINRLANAKKSQIELFRKLKQKVISSHLYGETVWLKRLIKSPFQYGANDSGVEFSPDLPRYVRITDITSDGALKNDNAKSLSHEVATPYVLEDGDVLLARSGATSGKAFIYKSEYGVCGFAGYLIRAKVDSARLLPEYLMWVTGSSDYEQWKNSVFIQATIQNISAERYSQLPIPLPSIIEQERISDLLNIQTKYIDTTINKLNEEINLFAEYRTRLISDVVTGKMDVRGVIVPEYESAIECVNNVETEDSEMETED